MGAATGNSGSGLSPQVAATHVAKETVLERAGVATRVAAVKTAVDIAFERGGITARMAGKHVATIVAFQRTSPTPRATIKHRATVTAGLFAGSAPLESSMRVAGTAALLTFDTSNTGSAAIDPDLHITGETATFTVTANGGTPVITTIAMSVVGATSQ